MNVQMRIITDENVDQLLSMSYSNNISQLLNDTKPLDEVVRSIIRKNTLDKSKPVERNDIPYEKPEIPEQYLVETAPASEEPKSLQDILKISDKQKGYVLLPGEESEMPEITPEMLENPTKAMYIFTKQEDGITNVKNKYTGKYDIITSLSKEDQKYIIQQPMKIQYRILDEIYNEYAICNDPK
jgi:hypothetical protein